MKSVRLWLGYDGSYVLCRTPLYLEPLESGDGLYLTPSAGNKCIDIPDADIIFGALKLKMHQVVQLEISVASRSRRGRSSTAPRTRSSKRRRSSSA